MRIRAIHLLAAAGLLSVLGCQQNEVVEKFEAIAEKTCQCTDAKCASDSHQELVDAIKAHAKETVTKGGATKLKAAVEKAQKCYSDKAATPDKSSTPDKPSKPDDAAKPKPADSANPTGQAPSPNPGTN